VVDCAKEGLTPFLLWTLDGAGDGGLILGLTIASSLLVIVFGLLKIKLDFDTNLSKEKASRFGAVEEQGEAAGKASRGRMNASVAALALIITTSVSLALGALNIVLQTAKGRRQACESRIEFVAQQAELQALRKGVERSLAVGEGALRTLAGSVSRETEQLRRTALLSTDVAQSADADRKRAMRIMQGVSDSSEQVSLDDLRGSANISCRLRMSRARDQIVAAAATIPPQRLFDADPAYGMAVFDKMRSLPERMVLNPFSAASPGLGEPLVGASVRSRNMVVEQSAVRDGDFIEIDAHIAFEQFVSRQPLPGRRPVNAFLTTPA
jgi:hypothetical protein